MSGVPFDDVPVYLYDHVTPSVPRKFGPLKADVLLGKPHFSLGASHSGRRASFTRDVGGAD